MKAAIVLRAGISKKNGKYVNYKLVKDSIFEHIIKVNPKYKFDIFIQSWNIDLKEDLINLYDPVYSLFENNDNYKELILSKLIESDCNLSFFNQVSQVIAIINSCDLVKEVIEYEKCYYEKIILYRPDVLLWKDLNLSEYSDEFIFCNSYGDCQGDFHFIFNQKYLGVFSCLFDHIDINNKPIPHQHIKNSILRKYGNILRNDSIITGLHQEVLRKLDIE